MRYAQEKVGQKLHLVCEAGEEYKGQIVRAGFVSPPLCNRKITHWRMTINMPLGNACKNCLRVK